MADTGDIDAGGTAITCKEGEGEEQASSVVLTTTTTTTKTTSSAAVPEEDARTADKRKADSAADDDDGNDDDNDATNHEGKPEYKKKFVMSCHSPPKVDEKSLDKNNDDLKLLPKSAPIKMSLNAQKKSEIKAPVIRKSAAVAKAFNPDEESDEEEMPPEAKMRMRNIGRDTPTAAGPNSYGKGRLGFCDRQKIFEREIKKKGDHHPHN